MAKVSVEARNVQADAFAALFDSGYCKLFPGTIPASVADAEGETPLVTIPLVADVFPAASGGVITMNTPPSDTAVTVAGTATWARFYKTDGTTGIQDVTVAVTGADMAITNAVLAIDDLVNIVSYIWTCPET